MNMMSLTRKDILLAQKYSINPLGMRGIFEVYNTLTRFVGFSIRGVNDAVTEEAYHYNYSKAPKYTYSELPIALKRVVQNIIHKYGSIEAYINQEGSEHNFISTFIQNKYQPKDFLFKGVLTPRGQFRGEYTDNTYTVEITDYDMGGVA